MWTNWSGEVRASPAETVEPASVAQLRDAVLRAREAGRRVRVAGSGHSFTPLVPTDGMLVRPGRLNRVLDVDRTAGLVRVQAGITLHALSLALDGHGLALENLGDIDVQTVAGALATATHGTGLRKPSLPAQVHAVQVLDAAGELHDADARTRPELWRAARVSCGVLGVLTEVTLRAVPAFTLRRVDAQEPLDEVLDTLDERAEAAEHFELFAFPYADRALTRTSRREAGPPRPPSAVRDALDGLLTNEVLEVAQRAGRRCPAAIPALCRLMTAAAGSSVRVDASHRCFASPRRVRFTETEWALPRDAVAGVVRRARAWIEERRYPVSFPFEVRFTAPDDAFLATAHGRETAYLAVHAYRGMPFEELFAAVAGLCLAAGGRPHWGKRHELTAAQLAPRYPRWEAFQAVRAELDPDGLFGNAWTDRTLGGPLEERLPVAAVGRDDVDDLLA
jgi:L-gulonolactone oxidase